MRMSRLAQRDAFGRRSACSEFGLSPRLPIPGSSTRSAESVFNTLRTGDADLRFYITTVQDGRRRFAFLHYNCAGRAAQICVFTLRTVQDGRRRFAFLHYELCRTGDADLRF